MTAFESRPITRSRAARSRQRLPQLKTQPLPVRSMSSLAMVRDLVKRVLQAKKNLKTRYPDEDDDDPD
jgi:hypothetical protein